MTPDDRPTTFTPDQLTQAFTDLATPSRPAYRDDLFRRTARTRQRPAWTFIERWLPMSTIAQRAPVARQLALLPRGLLILIALGLLTALTVAGLGTGAYLMSLHAVTPAPVTGPAANGLIAFERDGEIYVAEHDGSDVRPLIVAPGFQLVPVWSRDGTRIAYWSQSADGAPFDLVVAKADGTDATIVATGLMDLGNPEIVGADWSPDGATLAFSSRTIPHGEAACNGESDDGFCSSRVFVAAADGSTGAVAIGDSELDARKPRFSPDGSLIAFGGGDGRLAIGQRLYVMTAAGSDVRPISSSTGNSYSFVRQDWAPDGSEIVSQIVRGTLVDVVLVAADGSDETMLTSTLTTGAQFPSFAVDGSIGWMGESSDPCCVGVLDADGVRTFLPGQWPTWSPDGSLVVTPDPTDEGSLIVVDRAGTILATVAAASTPSWQRVVP